VLQDHVAVLDCGSGLYQRSTWSAPKSLYRPGGKRVEQIKHIVPWVFHIFVGCHCWLGAGAKSRTVRQQALVGCQGRGCAAIASPHYCHLFLLGAL